MEPSGGRVKRARLVLASVGAAVLVAGLVLSLVLEPPRRPRPPGWKDAWAALPLEREGEWALDPLKRGVVQASFFSATDRLTGCLQKHPVPAGSTVKLELLVETEAGGTHLEYVDAAPRPDLPEGLVSCLTRTLEQGLPVPTPRVPEGTRWRLELAFFLPPAADLPRAPWWRRFAPDAWHGGNDVG